MVIGPLAADVVAILVFVLVGRSSHAEHDSLVGIARTAWPFLSALAVGWVVARAWRGPARLRRAAVIWVVTVLVGHLLRLLSGQGSAWSFLLVTTVVLGVFLLGWRAVVGFVVRRAGAATANE